MLSFTSRINVGVLALALAWLVGLLAAGMTAEAIAAGFPTNLFLTLLGVTLLFSLADANGTLEAVACRALPRQRHRRLLFPAVFVVSCAISAVGPGAVAAMAFVAPLAMALAVRARVSLFLMALMIGNGVNAGNLSPISSVGLIARDGMAKAGLTGHEWRVFAANFLAHVFVGVLALVLLRGERTQAADPSTGAAPPEAAARLTRAQIFTLVIVAAWVAGTLGFRVHIGLSAFAAAAVLLVTRAADEKTAFRKLPLGAVVMVTGMTTLVALLEHTGGMELFTALLARICTASTVNGAVALVTGIISTYSSTSGVVMPAFLPTASALAEKVGGGDPLAVALSINVGAALVDVSPLSTIGAMCVALVSDPEAARRLFARLLVWGLSMTVVGGALCQLLAGPFARW
jgi:Na+/H+ antiporter NhaD/arsenite permease-like protein